MTRIQDILCFLNQIDVEYEFKGIKEEEVTGFSSLQSYQEGTMVWVKSQANIPHDFDFEKVQLAFLQDDIEIGCEINQIRTSQSKRAFFRSLENFFDRPLERPAIGVNTYISPQVRMGSNVKIGHNCSLDGEIEIGDNTTIGDNVTITNKVKIGKTCMIQSGARIGEDGYGYTEDNNHIKTMVKHYGGVLIGDEVLIGANTTIYRGTIDHTVIGTGCKIDGLCHIAHNVIMGEGVSLVAGTILYGSVKIENHAYLATSIIRNQCTIGKNAFVGMGSVVIKDVAEGTVVAGNPAHEL